MKTILNIFSIALCFLLSTCSKDKLSPLEQLPPITSKGANTFGCLVNGEPVIFTNPKEISYGLIGDYDSLGVRFPIDSFDIWLVFENKNYTVNLFLNNPLVNNIFFLNQKTDIHPSQNKPLDYIMIGNIISSNYTSGLFISDTLKKTIPNFSGTFEFECTNIKTCQTLKITNGRLDVNLNELQ